MLETFCSPDEVTTQGYPSPSKAATNAMRAHLKNVRTPITSHKNRKSPHLSAAERVARQLQEHQQKKLTAHDDESKEKETDSSCSSQSSSSQSPGSSDSDGEKEYKPIMDDSNCPILAVSKTQKGILAQLANPHLTPMDARGYTDQVLKRLFGPPSSSSFSPPRSNPPTTSLRETNPLSSPQAEGATFSSGASPSYSSLDIQGLRRFGACAICHNPWGLTPIMACQYCFLFVCSNDCRELHADVHTPAACDAHQLRLQPILDDLSGG